ncbi:hypothetical protein scyTo_0015046 [Scyliorhinus torazame]|uniref:Core Histone H2A/H2B/H3 domain-containing protein n=1 Tax=Scyliorhinus torazame TaxID=75743 RepID=A0A401P148_SCYTO|nr:hypothetical protein [Scyliorhinus torazame]
MNISKLFICQLILKSNYKTTVRKHPQLSTSHTGGLSKFHECWKKSYSIYKALKQVYPVTGISSSAMSVINLFVNDIFERITCESSRLIRYSQRQTISSQEIQTTIHLMLPGELTKHAVSEGSKAVTKYTSCK